MYLYSGRCVFYFYTVPHRPERPHHYRPAAPEHLSSRCLASSQCLAKGTRQAPACLTTTPDTETLLHGRRVTGHWLDTCCSGETPTLRQRDAPASSRDARTQSRRMAARWAPAGSRENNASITIPKMVKRKPATHFDIFTRPYCAGVTRTLFRYAGRHSVSASWRRGPCCSLFPPPPTTPTEKKKEKKLHGKCGDARIKMPQVHHHHLAARSRSVAVAPSPLPPLLGRAGLARVGRLGIVDGGTRNTGAR